MDLRIISRLEPPFLLPSPGVERVEVTIPASDKHDSVSNRWRRMHHIARLELPFQHARSRIESINIPVAAPEVNLSIPNSGRRQVSVEWIRCRLARWLDTVQMFRR